LFNEVEMKLVIAIAIAAFGIPALAQSAGKAQVFTSADVHGQLAQLVEQAKAKGSSGSTLGDYGTHAIKLSARTTSGGAEIHAHFDDVMLVTEGSATLITGGTVVDGHTGADGETHGASIRDGISQTISVGDVVHVPAGTPHQLVIAPGTTYSSVVIKVKE
jgi:mannose-6-phosphate isomerase-like protein (cupin superfamily)